MGDRTVRDSLESLAMEEGADLFGVADLDELRGIDTVPSDLLDGYMRAISVGVRLSDAVLETITDSPTPLYAHQYEAANASLDHLTFRLQRGLQASGWDAVAIAASQKIDTERWMGHVSHKAVGRAAGLGWLGKSLLLVNPDHGPRVRLGTVLTDAALDADKPLEFGCGRCTSCVDRCPVDAIRDSSWTDHPRSREEALRFDRCRELLVEDLSRRPNIGSPICGVCVAACPFGR